MFPVNRMTNGQRPNISSKVRDKRVPVAFGIAIAIVIIVSSVLFAGSMLSSKKKNMGIMNKKGGTCLIPEKVTECEFKDQRFTYIGGTSSGYPSLCEEIARFPVPSDLNNYLTTQHMPKYPDAYTYSYLSTSPILDSFYATYVLVSNCHGCVCLKLVSTFELKCNSFPKRKRSVQPSCDVYEGDTVNVDVSKSGTDPSSVYIQIVDQEATAADDYQEIAPFYRNFTDFGDQVMSFTIDTVNDNVTEGVETFDVQLSIPYPSSGSIEYPILTITIIDND